MAVKKPAYLSASLEDYLEAIFHLSAQSKVARSKDIAELLEVSRSSVTGALKTLSEKGLVNYKPYGFITLTDIGRAEAQTDQGRAQLGRVWHEPGAFNDLRFRGEAAAHSEHGGHADTR